MRFSDRILEPAGGRERKRARGSKSIVESLGLISKYSSVLKTLFGKLITYLCNSYRRSPGSGHWLSLLLHFLHLFFLFCFLLFLHRFLPFCSLLHRVKIKPSARFPKGSRSTRRGKCTKRVWCYWKTDGGTKGSTDLTKSRASRDLRG